VFDHRERVIMRNSKVLAKLRDGAFVRVCSIGHYLPFFIRHAAYHRYDAVWIDLEHATISEREVQSLLAACHAHDIDGLVRPPTQERTRIYRYLEDGASGLMMPMVSDEATARTIVQAAKFPPLGNRGFAGGGLDTDYALDIRQPDHNFTAGANRETFIIAQIETPEGVANADAIAAVPGIDALFVGPVDLGLRLAAAPGLTLDGAIEQVGAAARRNGKAWGITAGSLEELAERRALGAQIVPRGGDTALMQMLDAWGKELDALLER
jgi:2-keto-3-deoxy-L-rhamnonate aldolase RhmA